MAAVESSCDTAGGLRRALEARARHQVLGFQPRCRSRSHRVGRALRPRQEFERRPVGPRSRPPSGITRDPRVLRSVEVGAKTRESSCLSPLEPAQDLVDAAPRGGVEARGGLVEYQQLPGPQRREADGERCFWPPDRLRTAAFRFSVRSRRRGPAMRRVFLDEGAEEAEGLFDGERFGKLGLLKLNAQPSPKLRGGSSADRGRAPWPGEVAGLRPRGLSTNVVLPAPFGPSSPPIPPAAMSMDSPFRACTFS